MAKRKRKPSRKRKFKPFKTEPPTDPLPPFPVPEPEPPPTEEPPDPIVERWRAFQAADYEEQIALCHQTIEEETLMDEENAFEMFNTTVTRWIVSWPGYSAF